jgi:hypothetical protein
MSTKTMPMQVGNRGVIVEIRMPDRILDGHAPHLELTATCGETVRHCTMTLALAHDHTAEQFQKDIRDRAQLLAEEAAGHERGRWLRQEFFK